MRFDANTNVYTYAFPVCRSVFLGKKRDMHNTRRRVMAFRVCLLPLLCNKIDAIITKLLDVFHESVIIKADYLRYGHEMFFTEIHRLTIE